MNTQINTKIINLEEIYNAIDNNDIETSRFIMLQVYCHVNNINPINGNMLTDIMNEIAEIYGVDFEENNKEKIKETVNKMLEYDK